MAKGLCAAHVKQRQRGGDLSPLRPPPDTPLVKLPGLALHVAPEVAARLVSEAQALGRSVTEHVRAILTSHRGNDP